MRPAFDSYGYPMKEPAPPPMPHADYALVAQIAATLLASGRFTNVTYAVRTAWEIVEAARSAA